MAQSINDKPGQQVISKGNTTPPGNTHVIVKVETLTVHIFFDGTGNNHFNTTAHRENSKKSPWYRDVSYLNYYSNVALLFLAMKEVDGKVEKIYIQGCGTGRGRSDDVQALATAQTEFGRKERIDEAFNALNDTVGKKDKSKVVLNLYGFSRGAAWARHFAYLVKQHNEWKAVKINFLGIYDTVSSDGFNAYDDVEELGLDISKQECVNFIAHLTAENEYRHMFPLTRIRSAIKDNIGFECSFPGAHSDIGGGYELTSIEEKKFLGYEDNKSNRKNKEYINWQWFMNKGYYKTTQLSYQKYIGGDPLGGIESSQINHYATKDGERAGQESSGRVNILTAISSKRTVYNNYQFINANIMCDIARKKTGFTLSEEDSEFKRGLVLMKKIAVLKEFHDQAYKYVFENLDKKGAGYKVPILADNKMKIIYNLFIHNSLTYFDMKGGKGSELNKLNGSIDKPIRAQVTRGFRS